ncbi:MAG: thrombospondin type 3 repeat-containing protein [Gammaproteobacteria bacterium]
MPFTNSNILFAAILIGSWASSACAQDIDFESIAGEPSVDGLSISNQFADTLGVVFSLANGNSPVLAQVGLPQTAFQGFGLQADQPAPGTNAGQFFLTDDGIVGAPPSTLIIDYLAPVAAASGIILDIDGTEEWTIEALDGDGNVLTTVVLEPNNNLDGSATLWTFDEGLPVIAQITIAYSGTQTIVGLAFDNFSPSSIPPDSDEDGLLDPLDNCVLISNPMQLDTDGDSIGNACDTDINLPNDCVSNVLDLATLRGAFFGRPGDANWNPDADFNGDGVVNIVDLGILRSTFFSVPGPSGFPNACS